MPAPTKRDCPRCLLARSGVRRWCFLFCLSTSCAVSRQGRRHDITGFALDLLQVFPSFKTLGVYFVDIFRSGGPCGKPAVFGHHFQAPDGGVVAWRPGETGRNGFTGQFGSSHLFRRQFFQDCLSPPYWLVHRHVRRLARRIVRSGPCSVRQDHGRCGR